MKVLILMSGFFPGQNYGGPPVSVDNFCSLLRKHECYVVALNHDLGKKDIYENIHAGWNDRGNCKIWYLTDADYNDHHFLQIIKEVKPDMVYLQSIFSNIFPVYVSVARRCKIPVLVAPRGELCPGAIRLKAYKKLPYVFLLRLFLPRSIHFHSTSGEESNVIRRLLHVRDDHIHEIANVPTIPKCSFASPHKEKGKGNFVFISRIHPKKNLLYAIQLLNDVEGDVNFDIYGSIEDENYWQVCTEEIGKLPQNIKVVYKGRLAHDQVFETFSRYDAFLFPTLSENYGHAIVESLMVGTPVIISTNTPWTHLNAYSCGYAVPLDARDSFLDALNAILSFNQEEMNAIRDNASSFVKREIDLGKLEAEYDDCISKVVSEKT